MKNKTPVMYQSGQTRDLDWLYQEGEDDFLLGKTPIEIQDMWEDEE